MNIINKDTFWDLISQAKEATKGDYDAMYDWLLNRIVETGDPQQAVNFYQMVHTYSYLADKLGLWTAAMVMSNGWRSDDGFHYFEGWLIAQGKECYMNALENPDSLADIEVDGRSEFESIDYIGADAYEKMTGNDFYRDFNPTKEEVQKIREELASEIKYGRGIGDWHTDDAEDYLPKLCAKYPAK